MMKFNFVLSVGVLAAVLGNAKAFTKEESAKFEQDMIEHVTKCGEKFGVSHDDLKDAKQHKDIDSVNPCFLACVFKSAGVLTDDGKFDHEKAIAQSIKYVSNDEDKNKITEVATECSKVNDEEVSDGSEGCEISKLLVVCFDKHKDEFIPVRR